MSDNNVVQLCTELIGGCSEESLHDSSPPLPPSLLDVYFRINTTKELAKHPGSILATAALARSALTAHEDDRLRIESVQQLLNTGSPFVEIVLFGLLFDEDEVMRQTAVEGLVLVRSKNLELALSVVSDDKLKEVPGIVKKALADDYDSIKLYRLDPPPI